MKKLLSLIIVGLIAAATTSCGEINNHKQPDTPTLPDESLLSQQEAESEPEPFVFKEPESLVVTCREDFDTIASCLADMTLYEETDEKDGYKLTSTLDMETELPSSSVFVDGIELKLPINPKSKNTNGFELKYGSDFEKTVPMFGSSYIGGMTPDGNIIIFEAQNTSINPMKYTDLSYKTAVIAIDENKPVKHTSYGMDITLDTNAYDIVKHFGKPVRMTLHPDNDYVFFYELGSLEVNFVFSGTTGKINMIRYYYQMPEASLKTSNFTEFSKSLRVGSCNISLPATFADVRAAGFKVDDCQVGSASTIMGSDSVSLNSVTAVQPGELILLYTRSNKGVFLLEAKNNGDIPVKPDELTYTNIILYPEITNDIDIFGITAKTTPDEATALLGEYDYIENTDTNDYITYIGKKGEDLTLSIEKATGKISMITFEVPAE